MSCIYRARDTRLEWFAYSVSMGAMDTRAQSNPNRFLPIREDFGALVEGVDLAAPLSDSDFESIRHVHAHHGLLIFREQNLAPKDEIAFARRFNNIHISLGNDDTKLPGYPEISVLGNVVENGRPLSYQVKIGIEWHTDGTGREFPPLATVLYCLETPGRGGETLFASGKRAWEALSPKRQRQLESVRVVYSFHQLYAKLHKAAGTGKSLNHDERARTPELERPLVRTHSVTGRKALWFTESEMTHFVGMNEQESSALAAEIVGLISKPEHVYTHKWRPGDLLVWDNRWIHHSTTPYTYADERRLLHRISGKGSEIPY